MVVWCLLLILVLIVLGWRERKKNFQNFKETNSRLAQVEEVLLEICALVEEKVIQEDLPPLPHEPEEPEKPQELIEPEALEKPEAVETRKVNSPAGTAKQTLQTVAVQREKPILTREQP